MEPKELSIKEIHEYFLRNDYKVTNTQLVKYFRKFLTNNESIYEARKQFKTYVNILATIKTEGSEKYLILRKKYYNEVPSEESASGNTSACMSPISMVSMSSDIESSPARQPPPYRAPPQVSPAPLTTSVPASMTTIGLPILEPQTKTQYKECVDEFKQAVSSFMDTNRAVERVDVTSRKNSFEQIIEDNSPPTLPPRKRSSIDSRALSRENSLDQSEKEDFNKENMQSTDSINALETEENKISVKEAMIKFNRYASEEDAKIPSPMGKNKKPEKVSSNHPKGKEWIVSASRGNYQELAKLASEYPNLIKLQSALHWGAKHGNENVVKLIAGTYKGDVNLRTGYTALHISMQFGRNDIFELLCNVYKADRDVLDWSGKKPLDYQKQLTSVSASTFNKIKSRKKQHSEKDLGFLRIGSLNVRVKKTTGALSHFLGVGTSSHHHQNRLQPQQTIRSSAPPSSFEHFDRLHKNWGSDNDVPNGQESLMLPPETYGSKKRRQKRDVNDSPLTESHSMPTTPNQQRANHNGNQSTENSDHDSDTAYGFDSTSWRA
ncbi:unnamed protein product [Diamesa tonsa]